MDVWKYTIFGSTKNYQIAKYYYYHNFFLVIQYSPSCSTYHTGQTGGQKRQTDPHSQTKYCNPHCSCAPMVVYTCGALSVLLSLSLSSTNTDSSLSLHNLNTALGTLPPDELEDFGLVGLDIPLSQWRQIVSQYRTAGERQSALLQTYLTSHPAPSWQHVATALYKCELHTVLERVQTMFPSGKMTCSLVVYM